MPIEILMPALSPTMTEGNLSKWNIKEGDKIKPGQVIAEIETDKATMEVEAVDGGVIGKIIIPQGTNQVKVNSLIALLLEDGEDKKAIENYVVKQPVVSAGASASGSDSGNAKTATPSQSPSATPSISPAAPKTAPQAPSTINYQPSTNTKASPLARKVAANQGVDVSSVKGTGPKGRVIKADVEEFLSRGSASGVILRNPVDFEKFANSNIRQIIAKRLLESKQQVPHFYLTVDCNFDNLNQTRAQINDYAPVTEDGKPIYKISVNDFIIKASALALAENPAANASWYDDAIVRYNNVDISVAVATDNGLITPIIFNADQKSVLQISNEMKVLAKKARENKLRPEEFQGGGFSISNLGMYGIKQFSAIINPPQSCILAVGAGEDRAIVKNGKIEIANIVSLTLSVDHRSVDGAVGAEYLNSLKKYLENPALMLM
jgi:pyruvate dehydrogenase E2 component (dihydrolipoamide acetyltransferase)